MSQAIIVTTTCDQRDVLLRISRVLVEKKLAACCQIGGQFTSIYRWQGKIESSDEWICQIKTISDRQDQVISAIQDLHTYDEPEIVSVEINGGSESYLAWIAQQSSGG